MMRTLIMATVTLFFTLACGELLLSTVTIAYPFDESNSDIYTVNVDQAMSDADIAIKSQTGDVVDAALEKGEQSVRQELESQYGSSISVEFSYTPKPTIGLDDLLLLLNGQTVDKNISANVTVKDTSGSVIATETKDVFTSLSICDFGQTTTFNFGDVKIFLRNIDSYCADLSTEKPYLYMEQTTDPVLIKLSENKDMKKYKVFLDKIYSATLNDIGFTIQSVPVGISGSDSGTGDSVVSLSGDFFAQPIDLMRKTGSSWERCDREKPAGDCKWVGVNPESGQPEDFYAGDAITPQGKYYEQFYNVGAFRTEDFQPEEDISLQYTYYGKDVLQESIKALDFKTGVKARYTFRPGSKRLSGSFSAKIHAEFMIVVESI